jgi:MerR family transcriptional regulator, heat shock protein HspR
MTDMDRETADRGPATIRRLPTLRGTAAQAATGVAGARDSSGVAGARDLRGRPPAGVSEDLRALYVISVAAELAGVHPQTLRIYERRGLVGPSRTGGGSRRYSPADIERLRRIGDLTAAGVNLEGVRRVLELEAQLEQLRTELDVVRAEAAQAVENTHRQYRRDLVPLREASLIWRKTPRRQP